LILKIEVLYYYVVVFENRESESQLVTFIINRILYLSYEVYQNKINRIIPMALDIDMWIREEIYMRLMAL